MATVAKMHRRAHVVMPEELVAEVDALVGQRRRSQFITEAVKEKLRRRRRVDAFERVIGSSKDGGILEWETRESTNDWLHDLRQEWEQRNESDHSVTP